MKLSRIIISIGVLLLTSPALYAQDFLQKAKKFLDAGECEKAQMAYDAYKVEHPGGDAEVEQRMDECWKKFDGQPCPGTPTVTDYDGHTYNTVQIGKQCWMKENLRTKHYANGTEISNGGWDTSTTKRYYFYPNYDVELAEKYGFLYNLKAVMGNSSFSSANPSGVQGICPAGWHVPSVAEWTQLDEYVSSQSKYVCGSDNKNIVKSLTSDEDWRTEIKTTWTGDKLKNEKVWHGWPNEDHCQKAINATGFSALPAGYHRIPNEYSFGFSALFWTVSKSSFTRYEAWTIKISMDSSYIHQCSYGGAPAFSVRCVRD